MRARLQPAVRQRRRLCLALAGAGLLQACTTAPTGRPAAAPAPLSGDGVADALWLDRLSWGATSAELAQLRSIGRQAWLARQLTMTARETDLPEAVRQQLAGQRIQRSSMVELVPAMEAQRKALDAIKDDAAKIAAQQAYQREMTGLARQSSTRLLFHALYSPAQLREQMLWFWLNHFSVHQNKHNLRAMVGDYEARLRTAALGRFRDLLGIVVYHPAMLRYLDNDQNAVGRLNENYARELLELHTLGIDGGYSQKDVQELARVLSGLGVNHGADAPRLRPEWRHLYVRQGLTEFNPARHDFGEKQLLGLTIKGQGRAEIDTVLDHLARQPATARFISRKLAQFFVADEPDAGLVERMAERFLRSDGDIAQVLQLMVASPVFEASLGHKFKDPVHFLVSALRAAYEEQPVLNTAPLLGWLQRMGQAPYERQTPDGYPLNSAPWSGPGQLSTRFEIAKTLASGSAGLFKTEAGSGERPAFPQLATPLYHQAVAPRLSPASRTALAQAGSAQEWGTLLLSSPEFNQR